MQFIKSHQFSAPKSMQFRNYPQFPINLKPVTQINPSKRNRNKYLNHKTIESDRQPSSWKRRILETI